MKKIINFNNYIEDLLLENISKDLPFILSERLVDILKNIDHDIVDELLSKHNQYEKISLIDISDEFDKFTVSNSPKIIEYLSKYYNKNNIGDIDFYNYIDTNKDIWDKFRNKVKIGRLIKKLFGDKFPDSGSDDSIESFINKYKSYFNILNSSNDLFDIVEGDDIKKWYDYDNYHKVNKTDTVLHNSCMAGHECSNYLNFYAKNPNKVKMLILYYDNNKDSIIGRALLWYLDKPKRVFMDRIYYIMDHQIDMFKNYAKEKGWLYKERQSYNSQIIIDSKTNEPIDENLYVYNMEPNRYYPYLDTIMYYYQDTKILSDVRIPNKYPIVLRETDGMPAYSVYWSNYYNKYINENDDKYVECNLLTDDDDYDEFYMINDKLRLISDSKYFKYYNDYAPIDRIDNIINTTHGEKYEVLEEDAVWLKHYNSYTTVSYSRYSMMYSKYFNDYVDKKDLVISYDGDPLFIDKSTLVYRNELDASSGHNFTYVPKDKLKDLTYKKDGNYILKSKIIKNEN